MMIDTNKDVMFVCHCLIGLYSKINIMIIQSLFYSKINIMIIQSLFYPYFNFHI